MKQIMTRSVFFVKNIYGVNRANVYHMCILLIVILVGYVVHRLIHVIGMLPSVTYEIMFLLHSLHLVTSLCPLPLGYFLDVRHLYDLLCSHRQITQQLIPQSVVFSVVHNS